MRTVCPWSPNTKDKKPKDEQYCPVASRSILDSGEHKLPHLKAKILLLFLYRKQIGDYYGDLYISLSLGPYLILVS